MGGRAVSRRITAERIAGARAYAARYVAGEPARLPPTETAERAAAHAAHRRAGSVANFLRAERYGARVGRGCDPSKGGGRA